MYIMVFGSNQLYEVGNTIETVVFVKSGCNSDWCKYKSWGVVCNLMCYNSSSSLCKGQVKVILSNHII